MPLIENFGRNVRFTCGQYCEPETDEAVLRILRDHKGEKIRCIGALHSWSEILVTKGVVLNLRHLDRVDPVEAEPEPVVRLGAGCTIGRALDELEKQGYTLPTVGAIKKQTIAGAISTGTHGSGAPSLSHFIVEVRLATYDPATAAPTIMRLRGGDELRAARCALGGLGVILDVVILVRRSYRVRERFVKTSSLDEVMRSTAEWPLLQFALLPWKWQYVVYLRQETDATGGRSWAIVMRCWLGAYVDVFQHLTLIWLMLPLSRLLGGGAIRRGFRWFVRIPGYCRVDRSDHVLTLRHDLFRHVEMEVFVPEDRLAEAVRDIRGFIELGADQPGEDADRMAQRFSELRGRWTHHYAIAFRRIHGEDTLVSMASGERTWVSISFFTYLPVDDDFAAFTGKVARWLVDRYAARLHWGKYFPLDFRVAAARYPRFDEFEKICRRYDRDKVFWTESLSDSTRR